VFRWHRDFVSGRETVEDEPWFERSARLSENKQKRRPCEGFHSSSSMFDNTNACRWT
jgi:hypothetical protein